MRLETCDEPITSIQATVELETNHIGKGCDRDTYSEKSIHRLCGKNAFVKIKWSVLLISFSLNIMLDHKSMSRYGLHLHVVSSNFFLASNKKHEVG